MTTESKANDPTISIRRDPTRSEIDEFLSQVDRMKEIYARVQRDELRLANGGYKDRQLLDKVLADELEMEFLMAQAKFFVARFG